ncbi:MAG: endolytic transglycosylase MltG [Aestuariivita sp.]|nr:endolytic transglycosylase MltG [Aestuariivita sp.]
MARALASNGFTFLIIFFLVVAGMILWVQVQYTAEGPLEQAICLRVERGSTMPNIGRILEERGAISSALIFEIGADYSDRTRKLKAGSFLLDPGMSMDVITKSITKSGASSCGPQITYRIGVVKSFSEVQEYDPETGQFENIVTFDLTDNAVPDIYTQKKDEAGIRFRIAVSEGVTSWRIVESLKIIDILSGDIDAVPEEGRLAPDTYEIAPGEERMNLLTQMQEVQDKRLAETWQTRSEQLPIKTPEEMLILASIIEKEAGITEERKIVSSVFVNRLNAGILLQTDPTVIYGITKGRTALGRGLRRSELNAETPWNTYVIRGLPPTPIANPGLESLVAAAQPDDTPYFFFVADGTGGHAFAETLDEHNRNVAKWREIEAERKNTKN